MSKYEASVSHHTLCMGIWSGSNNFVYILSRISLVGNKQKQKRNKNINIKKRHCTDFKTDLSPETGNFFGPKRAMFGR